MDKSWKNHGKSWNIMKNHEKSYISSMVSVEKLASSTPRRWRVGLAACGGHGGGEAAFGGPVGVGLMVV